MACTELVTHLWPVGDLMIIIVTIWDGRLFLVRVLDVCIFFNFVGMMVH